MATSFNKDSRYLFAGDGLVDGGRAGDPESIGNGFVRAIREYLRAKYPPLAPIVLNRGNANGRLTELAASWEQDVIAERPDLISIHVDVDDPRHPAAQAHEASLDQFRAIYRHILTQTAERLPRTKLVLCEPCALWSSAPVEADKVVKPYTHALAEIAREFKAYAMVPFHSAMIYARRSRPDIQWNTQDHRLTSSGNAVLAYTWLEEMGVSRRSYS